MCARQSVREFSHYSQSELDAIIPTLESVTYGDVLLMSLYSGMSIADIMAITPESIDFKKGIISLTLISMEHMKAIDVKARKWDKVYILAKEAVPIIQKRLDIYRQHSSEEEYRKNNPYGFIFAQPSGEMPDVMRIIALNLSVPAKSGVEGVSSRRLIHHYRYVHRKDFYPARGDGGAFQQRTEGGRFV